jgi:hypothetical protein
MSDLAGGTRGALASRYSLERELGRGGMATVFLAKDLKHGREVALKVIRPELAAAVGAERFLREIEITAGLNHPHILPLLDSGAPEGLLFYVMPYVAGGSLRRLLHSDAELPLEAVLRIAREVASALDYAHNRGVVHRDIKPENILFNEGLAVVGDFGIAMAISSAPREKVTRTGAALGTLGYMSPEQALGTGELDAKTDVYSMGCVIYEMLVGGTPASWPGPEDVKLGRLTDLPAEHRRRLDAYPGRVEQVLARALALRAGDRYSNAGELVQGLVSASEKTPSFSESQVRQLLDRAAELQAQEPVDEGALTIGAVEQVAAQVGIPPEHVREAARELSRREPVSVPTVGGEWRRRKAGRWHQLVTDQVVEGEVPDSAYGTMVEQIQTSLAVVGHASVVGGSLTWSPAAHSEATRAVVISVTPRRGQTVIHIEETLEIRGFKKAIFPVGGLTAGAFGALIAEGLGMGEPAGPLFALLCVAGGIATAFFTATKLDAEEKGPQVTALARRLAELAEDEMERKKLGSG